MPQQIKYKTTDIPARHITLHGCEKEDDCIFVCSYVVVNGVLFQRYVMSLTLTGRGVGGSEKGTFGLFSLWRA